MNHRDEIIAEHERRLREIAREADERQAAISAAFRNWTWSLIALSIGLGVFYYFVMS